MKYTEYLKVQNDGRRYIIGGSYFTYKGVQYGKGTKLRYTFDFHKRCLINANKNSKYWNPQADYRMDERFYTPKPAWFDSIYYQNGNEVWVCGMLASQADGMEIIPDRDFEEILVPVYYVEPPTPKELVRQRIKDGTWINYIGLQTAFYIFCLIISPIFRQWYLIWTIGLYLYLRTSYITLSEL